MGALRKSVLVSSHMTDWFDWSVEWARAKKASDSRMLSLGHALTNNVMVHGFLSKGMLDYALLLLADLLVWMT